ncbi:MFS family permease [Bradyrhizobium sp. USDA 4369]
MTSMVEPLDRASPAPGTTQGVLLGLYSLVTVAAAVLLAPAMPIIVAHYAATDPGAEPKALFALSVPSLMVALCSSFVGSVLDRFGRKKVLVFSVLAYGCIGMAPALVEMTLNALIVQRIVLGALEAAAMTSSTTLIGDYFVGKARQKWLIMQTVFVSLSGLFFIPLGGALGEIAWNAPFYAYGLFILGAPAAMLLLHEPVKHAHEPPAGRFPWKDVLGLYGFGFALAVLILVVPIQLPFLLTARGITSPLTISMSAMSFSLAILVGSLLYRFRADASFKLNLIGGFFLAALGLALVVGTELYGVTLLGCVFTGLSMGFLMPTITTQIMTHLPFELRGRGTGRFNTAYFIGNFGSPLIVLGIAGAVGGLPLAIGLMAGFALICAALGLLVK